MIIKLAGLTKTIGGGIKRLAPGFLKEVPEGVALAGGIALADAGTEAIFAKPGERGKAALRGLGKGAVYGSILASVEPLMKHQIQKASIFR